MDFVEHGRVGKWDDGDAEPTSTELAVFLGIELYLVAWIIVCELLAKCSELYLLFGSASPVPTLGTWTSGLKSPNCT